MKNRFILGMLAVVTFLTFGLCSCSDDDDSRAFDKAQIVGVKFDGELFLPATGDNASETCVNVPAGKAKGTDEMPVGMQFAGPMFSEAKLLQIAKVWENDHQGCGIPLK